MYLKDSPINRIDFDAADKVVVDLDSGAFRWRVILIYGLLAAVMIFVFLSAFQLQIVEGGKNFVVATRTSQLQSKLLAPRGLIFDKNRVKLAQNTANYSLSVNPKELKVENEEEVITKLAGLIGINNEEFLATFKSKAYNEEGVRNKVGKISLKSDLSFEQYFQVLSQSENLPGVQVNVEPVREYLLANEFSNIIGYIGDPSENDINNGIYSESKVGKTGIEKTYDDLLRGTEGVQVVNKEILSGIEKENKVLDPVPGDNVILTVDSRWQAKLNKILSDQVASVRAFGGAGVIIKAATGEVVAMATAPNYDNNLFARGISGKDYSLLINDPKKPLFNRPIALQLPPGSIMKVFGATAGLESGIIDATTKKLSDRCIDLPGNIRFCEADQGYIGWVNVQEAMAKSSNIFFCKLMQDMHQNPGYNYYYDITRSFGIGSKSGIDIPGEAAGLLPNPEYKRKLANESWYVGDECNTVIGQGYVTVTPLQMAVAVSAVVNGGKIMTPHLVSQVENQSGQIVKKVEPEIKSSLNISEQTMSIIKQGLRMGVTAGTAGALNSIPGNSIGKTGSSDAGEWINGKYYSGAHSWVMGCFEFEGEEYCFTVMQQWGGRGYKTVPIMKKFINCVYTDFTNNCEAI